MSLRNKSSSVSYIASYPEGNPRGRVRVATTELGGVSGPHAFQIGTAYSVAPR